MAEETSITTKRKINIGPNHLTGYNNIDLHEVVRVLNECHDNNEKVFLQSYFSDLQSEFKPSETVEIRNAILECRDHIERFTVPYQNTGSNPNEYLICFYFFLDFLRANNATRHVAFNTEWFEVEWSLQHANQVANAIQSNNDGHIEKFELKHNFVNAKAFESVWNALLDNGVQELCLCFAITKRKGDGTENINFSKLSTNLSLKKIEINTENFTKKEVVSFFDSIKGNKGLEKISFTTFDFKKLQKNRRERTSFSEMLHGNNTLIDFQMPHYSQGSVYRQLQEEVTINMEYNRPWKRYIVKRKKEATTTVSVSVSASASASATVAGTSTVITSSTAQADKKKRFNRLLLHLFIDKPMMRRTIIFHLISEHPDVVDNVQQNQRLRAVCFAKKEKKKKRSYYTYQEK